MMNSNELLLTAKKAALAAGEIAREKFNRPLQITSKGFRDYVTDADIAAQEAITNIIREAFPEHGFLTEEDDSLLSANGPVIWIIDPIDGTTNYSRHIPLFCVAIAAVINRPPLGVDDVLVGVIFDPARDEMFTAVSGGQSQLNGRPIQASNTVSLEPAIIGTDWNRSGHLRQLTLDSVNRLVHEVDGISCFNTAALALAWVAAGRLDGYFNFQLKPWDVAAASLLIQQAEGNLTDLAGQSFPLDDETMMCLASNGCLHETLLAYMPKHISS